ncbi:hypothetical protein N657DRAFT_657030 [Parathielavia appendiculata]|uniref:Alpha and gamma adaptin binding protein p34 n=1 Tax=Parathielavia appendiculata TaxID=2587402 RepID=A0AAN6TWL2_9PEZI|nr:hypothetical protein N657DRAFT_657030 [Parathielavia appendiculata]
MNPDKHITEIPNPRRILAVCLTDSAQHLSDVINVARPSIAYCTNPSTKTPDLTGSHPSPQPTSSGEEFSHDGSSTLAGTTHPLRLATPYYTASVPIWLDLIASPAEWSASFLSPEAKEVLGVLGGVLVVFRLPPSRTLNPPGSGSTSGLESASSSAQSSSSPSNDEEGRAVKELITHVGRVVREGLGGWEWDGVGLAVGIGEGGNGLDAELDEWEDLCAQSGLEFVHVSRLGSGTAKGAEGVRNEFGERMGTARVVEALEANDWAGGGMGLGREEDVEDEEWQGIRGRGLLEDDDEFDPERLGFGFDREDFVGLRQAIWSGGEDGAEGREEVGEVGDEDVQKLERMIAKLQAVRDASAELPDEQRRRLAARAVGEVMKEL